MLGTVRHYRRAIGMNGVLAAVIGKMRSRPVLHKVRVSGPLRPLILRVPSSDVPTFEQIFVNTEYTFDVRRPPRTIVDAGANIGLASVFFAARYPGARILAIEPESRIFALLTINVAQHPNVTPVHGALWHSSEIPEVIDPGLGNWGFVTRSAHDPSAPSERFANRAQGMTVDRVMHEYGLQHVDILKIDIEGAEKEVSSTPAAWIERVDGLIMELHDRMKPGCSDSINDATAGFERSWRRGENLFLSRPRGCMLAPMGT